ncbi:hypothetical protein NQ318_020404 [Aromia moschata]|uniref:ISXO2-like transposase domain-containing protein n=1 Tax=Aromia moschata TaxID=1265417 RepID=A0AAV8Y3U7_9CUCU|nr:hypothetical protein NQ318_020404 [Aromia moschata]
MTPEEALSIFVEGNYTKRQYQVARKGCKMVNSIAYPSYDILQEANEDFYPARSSMPVTDNEKCGAVHLQALWIQKFFYGNKKYIHDIPSDNESDDPELSDDEVNGLRRVLVLESDDETGQEVESDDIIYTLDRHIFRRADDIPLSELEEKLYPGEQNRPKEVTDLETPKERSIKVPRLFRIHKASMLEDFLRWRMRRVRAVTDAIADIDCMLERNRQTLTYAGLGRSRGEGRYILRRGTRSWLKIMFACGTSIGFLRLRCTWVQQQGLLRYTKKCNRQDGNEGDRTRSWCWSFPMPEIEKLLPEYVIGFWLIHAYTRDWSVKDIQHELCDLSLSPDERTVISSETIHFWHRFCREMVVDWFSNMQGELEMLGGPDCDAQLHESLFGHRKYERGRVLEGHCVLGIIEDGKEDVRMVVVDKRDAATLIPIIKNHVKPGTTIHTDSWKAYDGLEKLATFTIKSTIVISSTVFKKTGFVVVTTEKFADYLWRRHCAKNGVDLFNCLVDTIVAEYCRFAYVAHLSAPNEGLLKGKGMKLTASARCSLETSPTRARSLSTWDARYREIHDPTLREDEERMSKRTREDIKDKSMEDRREKVDRRENRPRTKNEPREKASKGVGEGRKRPRDDSKPPPPQASKQSRSVKPNGPYNEAVSGFRMATWLTTTVGALGSLWESADLTVVESKDLPRPRVLVFVSGTEETEETVSMAGIRILQTNLQHSRAALASLTVTMRDFDMALIQEPWMHRDLPPLRDYEGGKNVILELPELPSGIDEDLGHNRIKSLVGGNILDMRKDHMTPECTYNLNFGMEIIDREKWKENNNRSRTERVTWYTDKPKTQQGTGADIQRNGKTTMNQYSYEKEQRLLQHLMETVDTDEEYLDADSDLDEEPNLEQGEEGQLNHEQDDFPSRESSEEDIATASRNSLTFVDKSCCRPPNRTLRPKRHLHRMGLYNGELKCRLCHRETETAHHILCDCETLDRKRQAIYGHSKLCPED